MNFKFDRNAKCPCNSNKKYKKCCINKNTINTPTHNALPPSNFVEFETRNTLHELLKNKPNKHCKICGDTEDDGKIVEVPTQNGIYFFCEFCYNVQINM